MTLIKDARGNIIGIACTRPRMPACIGFADDGDDFTIPSFLLAVPDPKPSDTQTSEPDAPSAT